VGAVRKPQWTSSSFLLYTGGLTVLAAALAALSYLSGRYGAAAYAGWSLLLLLVLYGVSFVFLARRQWIAAGIFAVGGLSMWTAFVVAVLDWWGWLPATSTSAFAGWHWGALLVAALVFAASLVDLAIFRFPLLVVFTTVTAWYFVTDLVSGGGSWSAVVTLAVGLVYLLAGTGLDRTPRKPYAFWVHVAAGLLVGGALLYWWHSSDLDWALVAASGVVFVGLASGTGRSSWALLGVLGILGAFTHFANEWSKTGFVSFAAGATTRDWVPPLVFGAVGFFIVLLGLVVGRRRAALPDP